VALELIKATPSPGLARVRQQIRQATPWGGSPRFLLHDNDGLFGRFRDRKRRGEKGRCYRCRFDLWLADVTGIKGIPIPYGAPHASPHIERFNRTLRENALNHFLFLGVRHVLRVCREYVAYYTRCARVACVPPGPAHIIHRLVCRTPLLAASTPSHAPASSTDRKSTCGGRHAIWRRIRVGSGHAILRW
jgi:hypothetical protein